MRPGTLVVGLALIVGVARSAPGLAQFKSDIQVVPLTVTVTNTTGRYVSGLSAADFTIFEEGEPQAVSYFGASDSPVDLALLIDTSSSMSRDLALAKEAACGLVRQARPGDRRAVAGVSTSLSEIQPMTEDWGGVEKAIRSMEAGGATALYEGIYILLRGFDRERARAEMRRRAIVLLSDGVDTSSRVGFEDVLDSVRLGDVAVYVISLNRDLRQNALPGVDRETAEAAFKMRQLARDSGGRTFTPQSARELPSIYDAIGDELSHQYLLGYTPRRHDGDGRFRRITVRVRHPEVAQARTRAGYYSRALRRTSLAPHSGD